MQTVEFTKMHGLGNDFVVIDAIDQPLQMHASMAQRIADRHYGIGCDQILIVSKPAEAKADFFYHIFNADGSVAYQCVNGARCVARFLYEKGRTKKRCLWLQTQKALMQLTLHDQGDVTVHLGVPSIRQLHETLVFHDQTQVVVTLVSLGNQHAVCFMDHVHASCEVLGAQIGMHPLFPEGINVGFVSVMDAANIAVRVFERGSGETHACGSGACAAVVAGQAKGLLKKSVTVQLKGGKAQVLCNDDQSIQLTGPASFVFTGVYPFSEG